MSVCRYCGARHDACKVARPPRVAHRGQPPAPNPPRPHIPIWRSACQVSIRHERHDRAAQARPGVRQVHGRAALALERPRLTPSQKYALPHDAVSPLYGLPAPPRRVHGLLLRVGPRYKRGTMGSARCWWLAAGAGPDKRSRVLAEPSHRREAVARPHCARTHSTGPANYTSPARCTAPARCHASTELDARRGGGAEGRRGASKARRTASTELDAR